MFSDTTNRIVQTAFLLNPVELLQLLAMIATAEAQEKRELDLTYEAHRWNDLAQKLANLAESV